MWVYANPNPDEQTVPDCVVRALCIALHQPWLKIYDDLCDLGREVYNMPSADAVWGQYLWRRGFEPFLLPQACPRCTTVSLFTRYFPRGTYIIGTGSHAVTVIDGNYYDSWDSGDVVPTFFWYQRERR